MYVVVRTAGDSLAVAGAFPQQVTELDSDQPVASIQPMSARVAASVAQRRMQMNVRCAFAGIAVLIAVVSIYGVMFYSVAQRSHEIGIRLASAPPGAASSA